MYVGYLCMRVFVRMSLCIIVCNMYIVYYDIKKVSCLVLNISDYQ